MKDSNTVWQEMLSILEVEIHALGFDVWVRPLRPVDTDDEDCLVLRAPTMALKSEVMTRYMPLMREAMRNIDGAPSDISIIVEEEHEDVVEKTEDKPVMPKPEKVEVNTINPKYNFENFVVGDCNKLAHAAAEAVAASPGAVYNPLFIYGGVGLGKTHIMQAIGNAVRLSASNLKVLYVSSETFVNEFIESIRTARDTNQAQSFRDKYRNVDVLIIDDVQFMGKKYGSQEELFHTFETLHNAGKQMVFASDRPPQDIPDLDSRVRSRFASSLVVDMKSPDLETRIAILQRKAQDAKVNIAYNALEFIAECVQSNIREMEGVLTKVIFLARLSNKKVDLSICREALNDYRVQACDEITADEIIECTCRYFNVNKQDVVGKKKNK